MLYMEKLHYYHAFELVILRKINLNRIIKSPHTISVCLSAFLNFAFMNVVILDT